MCLPDQYDTNLGNNGSHISGGQAQRMAIARALVRNPTILILDECTSNLDLESTKVIQESISRLVEGGASGKKMTLILITHSQEMMRCAERVVVVSHGEAVESGSFEELLKRGGELYRLLSRRDFG